MIPAVRHSRCLAPLVLMVGLAGCARDDEDAQRERLMAWVSLGETVAFEAGPRCAVGVYELVTPDVKSALPLTDSMGAMRRAIAARGAAAVRLPGQGGDAVLVAMVNHHRETGMAMRRAALEARPCMDATAEGAVRQALERPGTIVAWDADAGMLALMAPGAGRIVTMTGGG